MNQPLIPSKISSVRWLLSEQLEAARSKAKDAQVAELQIRKQKRELEEKQSEFELQMARILDEERTAIRTQALQEAAEAQTLKTAEKDKLINDLKNQIDELKRKSEQGSQQTQGEVLELELETVSKPF